MASTKSLYHTFLPNTILFRLFSEHAQYRFCRVCAPLSDSQAPGIWFVWHHTEYLNIPASLDGYTVTALANNAFKNQTQLTVINIPNSIKTIGQYAFEDATNLKSITLPSTLESIWPGAFQGCTGLTSFRIGEKVTCDNRNNCIYIEILEKLTNKKRHSKKLTK